MRVFIILGSLLYCTTNQTIAQTLHIQENHQSLLIEKNYMQDLAFLNDAMKHAVQHNPAYQGVYGHTNAAWRRLMLNTNPDQQQQIALDYLQYLANQRRQPMLPATAPLPSPSDPNLQGRQLAFEAVKQYAATLGCFSSFSNASTTLDHAFLIPNSAQLNDASEHYVVWWTNATDCDGTEPDKRHFLTAVSRATPSSVFVVKHRSILPSDPSGETGLTPDRDIESIQQRSDGSFDISGWQLRFTHSTEHPSHGTKYVLPIRYDGIELVYGDKKVIETAKCHNKHCQVFDMSNRLIESFELP